MTPRRRPLRGSPRSVRRRPKLGPLFGTTNQLVAGVTLLVVSIWLQRQGRSAVYTLVPMLLVGAVTVWAMVENVIGYFSNFEEAWLLAIIGTIILALDVWILLEGGRVLFDTRTPELQVS